MTLLHYLVETIESKFPELLTFNEDLAHVDKAARVSVETIQKTLRQMDASIRNLENDLNNNKQPQGDDDTFTEVMGVSFTLGGYIVSLLLLRRVTFGLPFRCSPWGAEIAKVSQTITGGIHHLIKTLHLLSRFFVLDITCLTLRGNQLEVWLVTITAEVFML